jgi:hypothetical protein
LFVFSVPEEGKSLLALKRAEAYGMLFNAAVDTPANLGVSAEVIIM